MRYRASAASKQLLAIVCAGMALIACGAVGSASAAPSLSPTLISVSAGSTRAVALESVTMRAEPFSLSSEGNFSPNDPRTRITLFVMNLDLLAGETENSLTADAEDAAHAHYPLRVEYVGQVPNFQGVYMVVMRLNDSMTANLGDVLLRLNLHGMGSNRVRVAIGQAGGGPADDPGAVGTPAPQTPPTPATPLTLAQYQAQVGLPAAAAGPDAIRFLEQTTWGPTDSDLAHLRSVGMQAYLNEQFSTPPQFLDGAANPSLSSNYPAMPLYPTSQPTPPVCDATCVRDNYTLYQLHKQFVTNALTQPDQLRQRVAFALHKLIVIAGRDMNNNEASWYAPYLQAIDKNAFGNFRQLLKDVTLNPGMGHYLDMAGNSRVAPNENYAREIMQLFSVGTDVLKPDGTPILDANGNRIPTYSQTEITNFARVFTGWTIASKPVTINGVNFNVPDYVSPMTFSNNNGANGVFDIGAKTLLNGQQLAACSNCTGNAANMAAYKNAELDAAMDNLFNHQNTAPYVCTQLIHQLVTSNPSPPYVGRCAAAFANNGSGTRGDMKAVITAILLDPEARGDAKTDPNYGHLREPVLLLTNLLRMFSATSDGVLVTNVSGAGSFTNALGQDVFNPPTVFSYFPADFGLAGTSLFGPEFGILDTSTTYQRSNLVNTLFLANSGNGIAVSAPNRPTGTQLNYASYQAQAGNPAALVDMLNTNMMHGTMSSSMRTSIINAVTAITSGDPAGRTRTAIYLVATSSQFQVER
ncbi:MAG: hypothetical protein QOH71_4295 [Blastocatellia bacterium]|nr:hypothetical protein [Blastocatellia bacterium]